MRQNSTSLSNIAESKRTTPPYKISIKEFQQRMLDEKDITLYAFISANFQIVVVNANEDEKNYCISNILDIKELIAFGVWKSARVVELEYDTKGFVKVAKIEAIH